MACLNNGGSTALVILRKHAIAKGCHVVVSSDNESLKALEVCEKLTEQGGYVLHAGLLR